MSVLMAFKQVEIIDVEGGRTIVIGSEGKAIHDNLPDPGQGFFQQQIVGVVPNIDKIKDQYVLGEVTISMEPGGKMEASFTILDVNNVFNQIVEPLKFFQSVLGRTVRIYGGYVGQPKVLLFEGYIQGFNTKFPESGRPDVTFRCLHFAGLVNNEAFTFSYPYKAGHGESSMLGKIGDFVTDFVSSSVLEDGVGQAHLQNRQQAAESCLSQLKRLNMKQWAFEKEALTLPEVVQGIANDYIRVNQQPSALHYYENIPFLQQNTSLSIVRKSFVAIKPKGDTLTMGTPTSTTMLATTTYQVTPVSTGVSSLWPTYTVDNPLIQDSVSDFTLLERLAQDNGCLFWIDQKDGTLYFVSKEYVDSKTAGEKVDGTPVEPIHLWYHRVGYPLAKQITSYVFSIGQPFDSARKNKHIPMLDMSFSIDATEFEGGLFGALKGGAGGEETPKHSKTTENLPKGAEQLIPHDLSVDEMAEDKAVNPAVPKYPQLSCTIIGEPYVFLGQIMEIHNVIRGADTQHSEKDTVIRGFVRSYKHRIGGTFMTELDFIVLPLLENVSSS